MKHPANLNSRELALLDPAFLPKVQQLLALCDKRGVKMGVHCTLIGPRREAELYAVSRTWGQVNQVVGLMRSAGAPRLAALFEPSMCQGQAWRSSALPGRSWHSWGQAVDCHVFSPTGKAVWGSPTEPAADQQRARAGYETYAAAALELGLTAGHSWAARDSVHVQLLPAPGVSLPWPEVQARMLELFDF